jgi:sugar phosphate isomerase/epimerase
MRMSKAWLLLPFMLFIIVTSCNRSKNRQPDMKNFYAWCIVPFDSKNRTPEERIKMLKDLGFNAYAYDWRERHLTEMAREFKLAAENGIDVIAVWMWIDKNDAAGNLSANNQKVLQAIAETGLKTQIWVSFPDKYFDEMNDDNKLEEAAEIISYISLEAEDLGCRVGLYNHGGWFGNPENLVNIIESMPRLDLGIIFNFHHAHHMTGHFPEVVKVMKPYLWAVNLNGMNPDGPKILPLGKGKNESEMVGILKENGYHGPFGILGHVDNADVEQVLRENIEGLKKIPAFRE